MDADQRSICRSRESLPSRLVWRGGAKRNKTETARRALKCTRVDLPKLLANSSPRRPAQRTENQQPHVRAQCAYQVLNFYPAKTLSSCNLSVLGGGRVERDVSLVRMTRALLAVACAAGGVGQAKGRKASISNRAGLNSVLLKRKLSDTLRPCSTSGFDWSISLLVYDSRSRE